MHAPDMTAVGNAPREGAFFFASEVIRMGITRQRDEHGLTGRQAQFVAEYVKDWNVAAACSRLGIKPASGYAYLKREPVVKRLDEIRDEMDKATVATAEEVAQYLTRVMRGEETEPDFIGCGVGKQKEIRREVKAKDRLKAAEMLGKHYGMFTERVEHTGNVPVTIVDDLEIVDDLGDSRNG